MTELLSSVPAETAEVQPEGIQSVEKALAVLDALALPNGPYPASLSDLVRCTGLHRSSVYRCLVSLVRAGYVDVDPATQRYQLSHRVLRLSQQFLRHSDVATRALPYLTQLRDATGETAGLNLLVRDQRVVVAQRESIAGLRRTLEVGGALPLYCSASGKAILAFAPSELMEQVLRGTLLLPGTNSLLSPDCLRQELRAVRELGYSTSEGEVVAGASAIYAPVFDHDGQVIGSIGVAGPITRLTVERKRQFAGDVTRAAAALSRDLGYEGSLVGTGVSEL